MSARRDVTKIPSLDGLRAVSFGIVFVAHAGLDRWVPGGFGVTVFFFLSGFLITTLLRDEHERHGAVSLKAFYLRRALRILPPFYVVLAVATAACAAGLLPGVLQPGAVAAQFGHVANVWIVAHGYDGQALGTGVYWSLAVEEHFYLVFPWLFLLLQRVTTRGRQQALVLYGLCALAFFWRCWLVADGASPDRTYLATDTRFDSILFGAALAVYRNPMLDADGYRAEARWKGLALPASLAVLAATFLWRNEVFRETARYSLQGLALTPIFICAMRWPSWRPFRLLNTRPLAALGTLSYSLYLVHHVALFGVRQHLPELHAGAQAAVGLAVSLAAAAFIHRTIERPCAALRKRFAAAAPSLRPGTLANLRPAPAATN